MLRSTENTPVKGSDEVVKRMQKGRAEKEWARNMLERGVVITKKDKENYKKIMEDHGNENSKTFEGKTST